MPYRMGGLEQPWLCEAASQTYKKGQMVYADTSGNIAICTQSSSIMTSEILGFAMEDGQNGSAGVPKTEVAVIRQGDILVANVWSGTPASAVTNRNMLGDVFGLTLVNPSTKAAGTAVTDVWVLDIDNSTMEDGDESEARCRVVGFPAKHQGIAVTIGDSYGPVLIQILPFSIASDGSPFQRVLQVL